MQQIIQQITDRLISRLPEDVEFYPIEDLPKYGYPSFLIKKIQFNLKRRLKQAISYQKTPLFNSEAESVQQAWQLFEKAVYDELQLPGDDAEKVINNAVVEVLNILLQPRKHIPNILFEENKIISDRTLINRAKHITVYQHFAQVLAGYMERKGRTKLTKEKCRDIIINIDEKLTRGYSPKQWQQILEPLFEIAGEQVDSKLFRLFFEDKEMNSTARYFERKNKPLNRNELIEILQSPELSKLKADDSARSGMFDSMHEQKKSVQIASLQQKAETESKQAKEGQDLNDQPAAEEKITETGNKNEPTKADFSENKPDQSTNFTSAFSTVKKSDSKKRSLNEIFAIDENVKNQHSTENAFTNPASQIETSKKPVQFEVEEHNKASLSENAEQTPIWKRFIDSEKTEKGEKTQDEKRSIKDLSSSISEQKRAGKPKKKLEQKLQDKKRYFIKEIFNGSESSYKSSLTEIASKRTWKSASKLVKNKIFEKNSVNIYSQAAVDFTDRLQSYFIEKQTINK